MKASKTQRIIVVSAVAAMTLGVFSASAEDSVKAATGISATVAAINELTGTGVDTTDLGDPGLTTIANKVIASGIINNNSENGWKLTVASDNSGVLKCGEVDAIVYGDMTLVYGTGTLGAGHDDPAGIVTHVAGDYVFSAGTESTVTAATEDYAFDLQITLTQDSTLLAGDYTDTITMTLAVDV